MRPQLALRPKNGQWQSRTDIPWNWQKTEDDPITPGNIAMATLHTAPIASTALTGAICGALELAEQGGYALEGHLDRLEAIVDCLEGADYRELQSIYGNEDADAAVQVVGSFFSKLAKAAKSVVPMVSKAVQFVPGVGPIASSALDIAVKHLPAGPKAAAAAAQLPAGAAAVRSIATPSEGGTLCFPIGKPRFT